MVAIKLSVFDSSGHLELKRELNENGSPPALDMIAERTLHQGEVTDVFQPFYAFGPEIDLSRMHLEFLFVRSGDRVQPVAVRADEKISVDVRPRSYSPAAFCLPLRALTLVHDGHDFYSHHRRYNLVNRYKTNLNSAISANLYAFDFMRVTAAGAFLKGDPNQKENWLTYGEPVFAPADGLVVEAVSDLPENSFSKTGEVQNSTVAAVRDPMGFGNHLKLRHADGKVSWLLHMEPNSIAVKIGNRVRAGQLIGKVGFR